MNFSDESITMRGRIVPFILAWMFFTSLLIFASPSWTIGSGTTLPVTLQSRVPFPKEFSQSVLG